MAQRAHLSPRQFHRRFLELTSRTPLVWLHEQRIARTKELLETTDSSIEAIAQQVGLGTAANLRVHFRRATSISPSRHRGGLLGHGTARSRLTKCGTAVDAATTFQPSARDRAGTTVVTSPVVRS